jgi:hypothetical protein
MQAKDQKGLSVANYTFNTIDLANPSIRIDLPGGGHYV